MTHYGVAGPTRGAGLAVRSGTSVPPDSEPSSSRSAASAAAESTGAAATSAMLRAPGWAAVGVGVAAGAGCGA